MSHRKPISPDDLNEIELPKWSRESFDELPFGVIQLDEDGRVLLYNEAESVNARRSVDETLGKLFFDELAPCANVKDFRGRYDALIARGIGSETFEYRFRFPWGHRDVRIKLLAVDGTRWILIHDIR